MSHIIGMRRYARETYPEGSKNSSVVESGAVQEIRFPIDTASAQSSTKSIPNGAIVIDCELDIGTPYSPGTTIEVGNTSNPSLLMATTDNVPTSAALYAVHGDTVWPGPATVLATVGGAPGTGAGVCIVRYIQNPET